MQQTEPANRINHFVLVVDQSSSMRRHQGAVVQVVDNFVADMAVRSEEMGQETRITVYTFDSDAGTRCLYYDMDALRRPSIAGRYRPVAMTPLIDAAHQAIDELAETPERYGEHSFVVFVITDGQENTSRRHSAMDLETRINGLPAHWTVAAFVPDSMGVAYAKRYGFPAGNIDKWDTTSEHGFREVGAKIRTVSSDFMEARARGVRGSKSIFTVAQVTPQAAAAALKPLDLDLYQLADVPYDMPVNEFAAMATGQPYRKGKVFYQLTKPVTVQSYKDVMVLSERDGRVYTGPAARQLLGLPGFDAKISPAAQPGTRIFIQSTSVNRKMIGGTKALILR